MTITPASVDGFPKTGRPWNNITPFTYRDGLTYLEVLEALRAYVRDYLVQHINDELNGLVADWNDQVDIIENAVSDALAQHSQEMHELADRWMQEQIENNDEITANILALSSSLTKTALEPVLVEYVAEAGAVQDAVDSRAVASVEQAVIANTTLREAVDTRARTSVEQAVNGNTPVADAVSARARTSIAQAVAGDTPVADAVSDRAVSAVNAAITEQGELSDTLKQETLSTATEGATNYTPFRDAIDQRVTAGTADAISTALADSQTLKDAAVLAMQDAAVLAQLGWDKTATPLTESDSLSGIASGIYRVGGVTVATALGLPIKDVSAFTVVAMSRIASNYSALLEQLGYDGEGGAVRWEAWRDRDGVVGTWTSAPRNRLLDQNEEASRIGDGVYGALASRAVQTMPPGVSGSVTEVTVGDSAWTQLWQGWRKGAADLLARSQSPGSSQVWQRPESPRAVEWAREEIAVLQASIAVPPSDGSVPSSSWTARAADTPMVVPTPDGTGQATHPSVLDVPDGWNGHRYWMAYTPYTYADDATEDPCVAWSDNGTAWTAATGALPLDDAPGGTEYNSDTNVVIHDGTMYVTWRQVSSGSIKFYLRTSTNGTTWTARKTLWNPGGISAFSQSLVKTTTGWRIWFVGGALGARKLMYVDTASSTPTSAWGSPVATTTTLPAGREPWHVEVHLHGGRWWGVLTDTNAGQYGVECEVRLMQSEDGVTWDVSPTQLIPSLGHSHDVLYKTSAVFTGSALEPSISLWYSGLSADKGWWLFRSVAAQLHEPRGVDDAGWRGTIPEDGDLDTALEPGLYGYWSSSANAPGDASGMVLVGKIDGNTQQRAWSYGANPREFHRYAGPGSSEFEAWQRVDGGDRLAALEQDTGWRNIQSLVTGYLTGKIACRRVGATVEIATESLQVSGTGTFDFTEPLGAGWSPSRPLYTKGSDYWSDAVAATVRVWTDGKLRGQFGSVVDPKVHFQMVYTTTDAWPSTLPGTPA